MLLLVVVIAAALLLQSRTSRDPAALERRIGRALARLDIESLEGHVVVCGPGAEAVADELARRGIPLVIVDRDAAATRRARAFFPHVYEGDARDPETLGRVGAERARALVACSPSARERRSVASAARRVSPRLAIIPAHAADSPQAVVDAVLHEPP